MKRIESNGTFNIVPFNNLTGTTSYRVTGWLAGKRIRKNLPNQAEALTVKQNLEREAMNLVPLPAITTRLTWEQAGEAESAFRRLAGRGMTLAQAVDYALANFVPGGKAITIQAAFDLFITEKGAENVRPATLKNLKQRLDRLVTPHGAALLSSVSTDILRGLILREASGPCNRRNDFVTFTNFFNWALAQGYCTVSPMAKIPAITVDTEEPEILTLDQVRKLVQVAQTYKDGLLLPYVALGMFGAVRPTELARLDWSAIDLEAAELIIGSKIAKMRGRRVVALSANVVELLREAALAKTALVGINWRRDFDAVKVLAGLQVWPVDVMRHTGISYHLALHQHEGKTATWAGNSPDVIQKHYKGLVKARDVAGFWSIGLPVAQEPVKLTEIAA